MHVDFRIRRQLVADHRRQGLDVESARSDVGGHQHRTTPVGEAHQHFVAIALFQVAIEREHGKAALRQLVGHFLGVAFGVAEHQGRFRPVLAEQQGQGIGFARRLHFVEHLFDLVIAEQAAHGHFDRIALHLAADRTNLVGVGGREQQRLPLRRHLRDHVGDRFGETHVEHAVGLVEHQHLHRIQAQVLLVQQLQDPTGRAHHDVRLMHQRCDLRAQRDPAAQRQHLHVGDEAGQAPQFLADLVGQLARRAQHQRLHPGNARIQPGQQAQAEGRGLAAAGLGLRDDVLALQDEWQAGRLDGRHFDVGQGLETLRQGGAEPQSGKTVHARLSHGTSRGLTRMPPFDAARASLSRNAGAAARRRTSPARVVATAR